MHERVAGDTLLHQVKQADLKDPAGKGAGRQKKRNPVVSTN